MGDKTSPFLSHPVPLLILLFFPSLLLLLLLLYVTSARSFLEVVARMPTLPKSVAHEYDPKLVFRSHSTNLPHLNSWIDELISLNESSLPAQSHPTTDSLVESLQRYDAVFRELLRQTSIFSEPVTKLLAKVWAGVLKLLDYMIKSYHRYVKHTSHLQTQAQNLLQERQGQAAAEKIKNEEFDL